jgi:hypothetical protein
MTRRYDPSGDEPVKMGPATVQVVTDKAVLVRSGGGREHWVPFSGIHDDSEVYGRDVDGRKQARGDSGTLIVKRWFARSKGWTSE